MTSIARKKTVLTKSQQLELENHEMEERLRSFREQMAREKAKRSLGLKGGSRGGESAASSIWIGGETSKGSLSKYASDVLASKKKTRSGYTGIGVEVDAAVKTMKEQQAVASPSSANTSAAMDNTNAHPAAATAFAPIPPSAEKPTRSQAPPTKRVWRVPTAMKMHGETIEELERETAAPPPTSLNNILEAPVIASDMSAADSATVSSNSLLDGDGFDAEASHQSFLEALRQWRGEPAPTSTTPAAPSSLPPKYTSKSVKKQAVAASNVANSNASSNSTISSETNTFIQQTVAPAVGDTAIKFEFKNRTGLCYFDQLRLQRGLASPAEKNNDATLNSTSMNSVNEQQSRDAVGEEKEEWEGWDSNDELAFLEIMTSKKKTQDEIVANHCNSSLVMEPPSDDDKDNDKSGEEASEQPWVLVMQDITGMEDEVIMESLDAGILVECIPTTRLQVIHPKD